MNDAKLSNRYIGIEANYTRGLGQFCEGMVFADVYVLNQ